MDTSGTPRPNLLPRRVFFGFIGGTVLAILAAVCYSIATGWVPPRSFAGTYTRVVLPAYFGVLVVILTLSYLLSGNTLMHHYHTGTVQRGSSPTWFWWIVIVQALTGCALVVIAYLNW